MTQKELILSWGKGAVGTIEQTNDLTIGEVILTYRQLKALSITNPGTPNLKPNMATLLRVIRQRVQNNMGLCIIWRPNPDIRTRKAATTV